MKRLISVEESGNAKERVTESDSARKGRIDLTQFEGIWDKKHHLSIEKTPTDGCHWTVYFENDVEANMSVSSEFGKEIHEEADRFYHAIDKLPDLIAELKKCYEIIDIYQSTGEDFDTQLAFHEKGLCEYLKHPCGPCEGEEGYYDDPLELSPELQAFYERGPSPRRTTEKQMEEAQRKREYGHSRPSVDDYDPVYDDPNYDEGPWEE